MTGVRTIPRTRTHPREGSKEVPAPRNVMRDGRVRYDIAKPIRYRSTRVVLDVPGPPGPAMLLTRKLGPRPPFVRTHASNPAFRTGGGGIVPPL